MDIAHAAQLAINQPVNWKCVYRRAFRPDPQQDVDELGAGDLVFVTEPADLPNFNPNHVLTPNDGLLLSIERPANAQGAIGEFAAAITRRVGVPDNFVLAATFGHPSQVSLTTAPPSGTYAPAILIKTEDGRLMGASCQFNSQGARLNLPHTGVVPNLPFNQLLAHGTLYRLVLMVSRTATAGVGRAALFIDNHSNPAESISFEFSPPLTTSTWINDVQAGIGTANGSLYRASVHLYDFEIWAGSFGGRLQWSNSKGHLLSVTPIPLASFRESHAGSLDTSLES